MAFGVEAWRFGGSRRLAAGLVLVSLGLAGCQTTAEISRDLNQQPMVEMAREDRAHPATTASIARAPQAANQIGRVYLLRGLGDVFSRGMDDLGAKFRASGVNASVHSHASWEQIAADILSRNQASRGREPITLIGHSLGADNVVRIANFVTERGGTVNLVVAFDPVSRVPVRGGRRVVNFYQSNNGWAVALSAAPGFRGRFENVDLVGRSHLNHFNIEKDRDLHTTIMGWVRGLNGGQRRASR